MDPIVVHNLCKTFENVKAVDDVSFSVKKGEIFGLLGANGAGKTTTINMISGLTKQDSGTVHILGKTQEEDWELVKNNSNVSTAYYPLSDVLSIRQNLRIYAKIYGVKRREEKIDQLLKDFELTKLGDRRVRALSSGEKTRTVLCKGFINDPQVLFLDEATVGLDPDIAEKTRNLIRQYQKQNNATILFTSHYMFEVEELCKRIAFMDKGKILRIATADQLKKAIKHYTVEIAVKNNLPKLKQLIQKEDVNVLFAKNNTLIFEVEYKKDRVYKILNKVFKQGFLLSDLHIKKPTLDDIFIKIARREK